MIRLHDVDVGRHAGDQEIGLLLGVHQVAEVPRVDDVERPVAHDDALLARARSNRLAESREILDLVPILGLQL
ncbi:hypothetical protein D3C83_48150 [compost metagenome]